MKKFYDREHEMEQLRDVLLSESSTLLAIILLVSELPASLITNSVIPFRKTYLIQAKTPVSLKLK